MSLEDQNKEGGKQKEKEEGKKQVVVRRWLW